jgi:uncharacterized protein
MERDPRSDEKVNQLEWTIVTGASSGVGLEMAKQLAEKGRPVVIVARRENILRELAAEWTAKWQTPVLALGIDLASPRGVAELVQQIGGRKIIGLINNAGLGNLGAFVEREWEVHERILHLNIITLTHITHALLPRMLKQGHGQILNVCSVGAYFATPFFNIYCASKAFVFYFGNALNEELRGTGVSVTTFCPPTFESGFHEVAQTVKAAKYFGRVPSSETMAKQALKAMRRKRRVSIPTIYGHLLSWVGLWVPRGLMLPYIGGTIRRRMAKGHL